MKLISEFTADNTTARIVESKGSEGKKVYIEGIFMQSEKKNRNGRIYPKSILMKEVERYTKETVDQKRAFGELGHPDSPSINLERVSHLTQTLRIEGNDVIGRAVLLDTPYGNIASGIVQGGGQLGVSTRGMGSVRERNNAQEVQHDYQLATIDIVADPSAPDAFVDGIMESREWICESGVWKPYEIEAYKDKIRKTRRNKLNEAKLEAFQTLMARLSSRG